VVVGSRVPAVLAALVLALSLVACDLEGGAVDAETLAERAASAEQARQTAKKDRTSKAERKDGRRIVRKRVRIPPPVRRQRSSEFRAGTREVLRAGRAGVRMKVFRVTVRDGEVVQRTLVRTRIVRNPVARVILIGTGQGASVPSNAPCDVNYTGACVPFASDVDCLGSGGDGPGFVRGPVRVVGLDVYGLDPDGDGWGCD